MIKKDLDIKSIIKASLDRANSDLGFAHSKPEVIVERTVVEDRPETFLPALELKTKTWGIKGTTDSDTLDSILENIVPPSGDSLTKFVGSLNNLNSILHVVPGKMLGIPVEEKKPEAFDAKSTFAALQISNLFYSILNNQSAKTAGMIFESVMARMMGGRTVPESEGLIEDYLDAEGNPISLKVLTENSSTDIKGAPTDLARSIVNISKDENDWDKGIRYLVIVKDSAENVFKFSAFSFIINKKNYFNFMLKEVNPITDAHYEKIYNFVSKNYYSKDKGDGSTDTKSSFEQKITGKRSDGTIDDNVRLKIKDVDWQPGKFSSLKLPKEVASTDIDDLEKELKNNGLKLYMKDDIYSDPTKQGPEYYGKVKQKQFTKPSIWQNLAREYGYTGDINNEQAITLFIHETFKNQLETAGFKPPEGADTLEYGDISLGRAEYRQQQNDDSLSFVAGGEAFNQKFFYEFLDILPMAKGVFDIINPKSNQYEKRGLKIFKEDSLPLFTDFLKKILAKFIEIQNISFEDKIRYLIDITDDQEKQDLQLFQAIFPPEKKRKRSGVPVEDHRKNATEQDKEKARIRLESRRSYYEAKYAEAIKRIMPVATFIDNLLKNLESDAFKKKEDIIQKGNKRKEYNIYKGSIDPQTGERKNGEVWKLINFFFHGPLNQDATATSTAAQHIPSYLKKKTKITEGRTASIDSLGAVSFKLSLNEVKNIAVLTGAEYKDDYPEVILSRELLFSSARNNTSALKNWIEPIFKEFSKIKAGLDQYYIYDNVSGMVEAHKATVSLEQVINRHVQVTGNLKASELREEKSLNEDFFNDILKSIL